MSRSRIIDPAPRGAATPKNGKLSTVNGSQDPPARPFPELDDAAGLIADPPEMPPSIIEGVLHEGWKMVLGGSSKSFKTWSLTHLAIAVATGGEWWGFSTKQGRVLYIQLENQRAGFAARLKAVSEALGVTIPPGSLMVWNLRGHTRNVPLLISKILEAARGKRFSLIIIDPLYKIMAGRDENAAGQMSEGLEPLDLIAEETGAAVGYGHHFSKGNQAAKESIDRMSGSGVFARDADSIVMLTKHEADDAFTVEPTLRECPPVEPFVVRWQFPLMQRDGSLDPARLKQAKTGRSAEYSEGEVLAVLKDGGAMTTGEWKKACAEEQGISDAAFYRLRKSLVKQKRVVQSKIDRGQWMAA